MPNRQYQHATHTRKTTHIAQDKGARPKTQRPKDPKPTTQHTIDNRQKTIDINTQHTPVKARHGTQNARHKTQEIKLQRHNTVQDITTQGPHHAGHNTKAAASNTQQYSQPTTHIHTRYTAVQTTPNTGTQPTAHSTQHAIRQQATDSRQRATKKNGRSSFVCQAVSCLKRHILSEA